MDVTTRIGDLARDLVARLPEPLEERARRVGRRVLGRPGPMPPVYETRFPERPVGAKFELTHRCNLVCGFCYTDSPVATRSRPVEMTDDEWLAVVDDALDLGIVEAVVSGGEPFFRKNLTLDVVDRIDAADVAVLLNTNGWFLDDAVADRLADTNWLTVVVSVDGVTPDEHDHARGVRGSWERAVAAVDRLVQRKVNVRVNHVVTPDNLERLDDFCEAVWHFGVRSLRVTPVGPTGSATRGRDWGVDDAEVRRVFASFCERHGSPRNVRLAGVSRDMVERVKNAPRTVLVKPDGSVLVESGQPFAFGNVRDDGLATCWANMGDAWEDAAIGEWSHQARDGDPEVRVAYRDPDVFLRGTAPEARPKVDASEVTMAPVGAAPVITDATVAEARRRLLDLVLARRHVQARLRWSGDRDGDRYVRLHDGIRTSMNRFASLVMDAADDATGHEAVEALAAAHPDADRDRLTHDVVATVNMLRDRGILVPVATPTDATDRPRRLPVASL